MPYESLAKLFYKDNTNARYSNADERARVRLEAESTFRTGIKTPSGEFFLAVPRELSLLNETVLKNERKIAAGMSALPPLAEWAMIRDLVVNEVVSTNELEGVHSTRRQIDELLRPERSFADPLEKKRFRELAKLYLGLCDQDQAKPAKPEDIRSIYDKVMDGEPLTDGDRPDGKIFRKDPVDVIGAGGKAVHEGLYPESEITNAMEQMLALVNSEEIPQTLSSIVAHFVFEYVHPFYDGNGRTGRYLLALYLSTPLSTMTCLSLSRVIAEHRDAYFRSFKDAEHPLNHGELTMFVMNMLELVKLAQDELDDRTSTKKALLEAAKANLDGFADAHGLAEKELDVVYMLAQLRLFATFPESYLEDIAVHIGLGKQQARTYTRALEEMGIVEAVSKRPLRFVLSDSAARELGLSTESTR